MSVNKKKDIYYAVGALVFIAILFLCFKKKRHSKHFRYNLDDNSTTGGTGGTGSTGGTGGTGENDGGDDIPQGGGMQGGGGSQPVSLGQSGGSPQSSSSGNQSPSSGGATGGQSGNIGGATGGQSSGGQSNSTSSAPATTQSNAVTYDGQCLQSETTGNLYVVSNGKISQFDDYGTYVVNGSPDIVQVSDSVIQSIPAGPNISVTGNDRVDADIEGWRHYAETNGWADSDGDTFLKASKYQITQSNPNYTSAQTAYLGTTQGFAQN